VTRSTQAGFKATVLVPLAAPDRFLGMLRVSVNERPERLRATLDLVDRLSGVAAQATTALQNGHLLDQITHQALHDQLTGLANRSQFASDLRAAVHNAGEGSGRVTLFYIDLNRFKPVNDEFGHETGDALLVAVGARLAACTRKTDTVARLGGERVLGSDSLGEQPVGRRRCRRAPCRRVRRAIPGRGA